MKVGDLVQTTLTGLGKPTRTVMGLLIKPIATYFWSVFLVKENTYVFVAAEDLEVINASR
jgi:hypothetical protein